jgi:NADH dehydrogenase [ubiquinone] 1 alpha subcomplex assembly factor 5
MLHRDDDDDDDTGLSSSYVKQNKNNVSCETFELVHDIDSQSTLPFPSNTFDLVISSMSLHWVNNLPQLLSEVERILRPDGCFLFALPGGNTLPELRSTLVLAELERTGGVSTHVGPYVDLSNVGSLLTGVGFKLPTIDIDDVHIGYPNSMTLMEHLGRMGEGNACTTRKERVGLGTFLGAACLYDELYPTEDDNDGGIVASVQVIYGIAWKEHESQQKPDARGSATKKIGDVSITKTSGDE